MHKPKLASSPNKIATAMEQFVGFPAEGVDFLRQLRANNNKPWFETHKAQYKRALEAPAQAFAADFAAALAGSVGAPMTPKLFRIYRDVRFSKDKTPYKTHVHMLFRPSSASGQQGVSACPAIFFGLETEQLIVGAGCFSFAKDALKSYQSAVATPGLGAELAAIVADLRAAGLSLGGDEYKRVPAGFDPDYRYADLLRLKGLSAWCREPHPPELDSPSLVDLCLQRSQTLLPLYRWLERLF